MAEKENKMVKVDNGTADVGQKMYKFEDSDIDLIVRLLKQELEMHVYADVDLIFELTDPVYDEFCKRRNHLQSLINEFCK